MRTSVLASTILGYAVMNTLAQPTTSLASTNVTQSGSCIVYSSEAECSINGNRESYCLTYNSICPVGYSSPYNATDDTHNKAVCADVPTGNICNVVWTCCL